MVVLNAPSHPQVLFVGFAEDDPGFLAMADLVPVARIIEDEITTEVRPAEWDVVVAKDDPIDPPDHMHVLAFGCAYLGTAATPTSWQPVKYGGHQMSPTLRLDAGLAAPLRRLVTQDLVPWLDAAPARPYLTGASQKRGMRVPFNAADVVAFVRDADGNVIAGDFLRSPKEGSRCWALPFVPEHPERWLAAALADWHERTPDRVPMLPGWRTRPTWRTAEEEATERTLTEFERRRANTIAALDEEEERLRATADAATRRANAGDRRLLTEQGEPLVAAVRDALTALGFAVEDADAALAPGEPKVEDLRVGDPVDADWTNITEVKGYTGGGRSSDLQKIGRYVTHYVRRTGSEPESRWYVVNHHLHDDPDTRPQTLAGTPDDVEVFAEDGGLVVDSRDLFRLVRAVTDGTLDAAEARAALRKATGIFASPS